MDLRSSRSRSKTPFALREGSQETYEQQSVVEESVVQHSYSTRSRNIKYVRKITFNIIISNKNNFF